MEDKAAHKIWLARRSSRFSRFQEGHGVRVAGGQGLSVTLVTDRVCRLVLQGLSVGVGSYGVEFLAISAWDVAGGWFHAPEPLNCGALGGTPSSAWRAAGW